MLDRVLASKLAMPRVSPGALLLVGRSALCLPPLLCPAPVPDVGVGVDVEVPVALNFPDSPAVGNCCCTGIVGCVPVEPPWELEFTDVEGASLGACGTVTLARVSRLPCPSGRGLPDPAPDLMGAAKAHAARFVDQFRRLDATPEDVVRNDPGVLEFGTVSPSLRQEKLSLGDRIASVFYHSEVPLMGHEFAQRDAVTFRRRVSAWISEHEDLALAQDTTPLKVDTLVELMSIQGMENFDWPPAAAVLRESALLAAKDTESDEVVSSLPSLESVDHALLKRSGLGMNDEPDKSGYVPVVVSSANFGHRDTRAATEAGMRSARSSLGRISATHLSR